MKLIISLDEHCVSGLYETPVVESLVIDFEEQMTINISDTRSLNITSSALKDAADLFIYLISCPKPLQHWFQFYDKLFKRENPTDILLMLNRIMSKTTRSQKNDKIGLIAHQLFMKVTSILKSSYLGFQNISEVKSYWTEGAH